MRKKLLVLILTIFVTLSLSDNFVTIRVFAYETVSDSALDIAEGIISWKKNENGSSDGDFLIGDKLLEQAGTTAGDWYPIGLGRLNIKDNNSGYLAVVKDKIEDRYRLPEKLSSSKATEWHRISLAVLAMGGDPTQIGTDEAGNTIDLIADGTYDRGRTVSLGRQGINGWIWGLIALDSMRYEIPEGAYYSREDIITEILKQQLDDGGFALAGTESDPDITAMAIQAFTPYRNDEKVYTYRRKSTGSEVSKSVDQVISEALDCLSRIQLSTGDYESWGTENVESTAQVLSALCSLGIDPLVDERFIKNGNTLLDGIMRYKLENGGFTHSFAYDPENPDALPNQANSMAGEQTLCAMAALWRMHSGMRNLYDFRPEQSEGIKKAISDLELKIDCITEKTSVNELEDMLYSYYRIPDSERSYVKNYRRLSESAKKAGIDIQKFETTVPEYDIEDPESGISEAVVFTDDDKNAVNQLPEDITTNDYVTVTTLLDKLEKSGDFDGKEEYHRKLEKAKKDIEEIQNKIDSLNSEIKEDLYPFEELSLKDKKTVDRIVKTYDSLSEPDRAEILSYEDVIRAKTKIDNKLRGMIISVLLLIILVIISFFLIRRICIRRHRKEEEMSELENLYDGEDREKE